MVRLPKRTLTEQETVPEPVLFSDKVHTRIAMDTNAFLAWRIGTQARLFGGTLSV